MWTRESESFFNHQMTAAAEDIVRGPTNRLLVAEDPCTATSEKDPNGHGFDTLI